MYFLLYAYVNNMQDNDENKERDMAQKQRKERQKTISFVAGMIMFSFVVMYLLEKYGDKEP